MSLRYEIATSEFGLTLLQINYKDNPAIEIELGDFYKDMSNLHTLYYHINNYIATLSDATQSELYSLFHKVYSGNYSSNFTDISFINRLENNIAKASSLLSYDNFKIYIRHLESQMLLPDGIKEIFEHDIDMNTTREKTYIKSEYIDLISLVMFVRALSPLYIDYYNYIKQITIHSYYKLLMLLVKSDIYDCEEITKLKVYIAANQETLIVQSKQEYLILDGGLNNDEMLDSLTGEVIFNKLLTIDFFNKKCNIISFIFQTIKYKGNFITTDKTAIRSKVPVGNGSKEDIGCFEDYRKISGMPIGSIVEIQHSLSNVDHILSAMPNYKFDFNMYYKELELMSRVSHSKLEKIQIYLLQWLLNKVNNPKSLYYVDHRKIMELVALAKVILMCNNQEFIGLFINSVKSNDNGYVNVIIKNTISKEILSKLEKYYKFSMSDGDSIIEKTISESSKEISNYLWIPVCEEGYTSKYVNKEGYLIIPSNINELICEYVEFVNT